MNLTRKLLRLVDLRVQSHFAASKAIGANLHRVYSIEALGKDPSYLKLDERTAARFGFASR